MHFEEKSFITVRKVVVLQYKKRKLVVCKHAFLYVYYKLYTYAIKIYNSTGKLYHLLLDLHCRSPHCTTLTITLDTFSLYLVRNRISTFRTIIFQAGYIPVLICLAISLMLLQDCRSAMHLCHLHGSIWFSLSSRNTIVRNKALNQTVECARQMHRKRTTVKMVYN